MKNAKDLVAMLATAKEEMDAKRIRKRHDRICLLPRT